MAPILPKALLLFYNSLSKLTFADSSDKELINRSLGSTIITWLKLCIEKLQKIDNSPQILAENHDLLLRNQRIILKILTVFFRDFPIFSKGYAKETTGVILKFFVDFIPK